MSAEPTPHERRLRDLLADDALGALPEDEGTELGRLTAECPEVESQSYELAAAALHQALLPAELSPLPAELRRRLESDARTAAGAAERSGLRLIYPAAAAWAVAAALLVALFLMLDRGAPLSLDPADMRAELLARADDALTVPWQATVDPLAPDASGDVVWSAGEQRGYMRFADLPANDPGERQYQLWIFDAGRPESPPVDGGVFDVPAAGSEVVVPIDPKLEVFEVQLFAVTAEPPGGVVVSDQEHVLLTAAVD